MSPKLEFSLLYIYVHSIIKINLNNYYKRLVGGNISLIAKFIHYKTFYRNIYFKYTK